MEKNLENTLIALLETEAEARSIVEKAEKEAKELREQTRKEVQMIIEEAKTQEEQEIKETLSKVRAQVELTRKEISDRSKKEAQHWEELFQRNHDKAVNFVIEQIISKEYL